jgi:hypothetical protein
MNPRSGHLPNGRHRVLLGVSPLWGLAREETGVCKSKTDGYYTVRPTPNLLGAHSLNSDFAHGRVLVQHSSSGWMG